MRDWKQWLDQIGRELYNTKDAYKNLLPQLDDIEQYGREYRSHYKLDGQHRQRADKTVILERMPLVVIEHGEPAHNIVRYIIDTQHKDFITVARQMAELTGMELPQGDFDSQKWLERQRQKELIATVQDYYRYCLQNAKEPIKEYLHSRFTDEEIDKMQLGYIASQEQLVEYLTKMHYTQEQVKQFTDSMPWGAGKYHHITIPIYRAGNVYSFIYRHHNQADIPAGVNKYQYHYGKDKLQEGNPYAVELTTKFAYIPSSLQRGNKELVVVEGQLDCLHLLADGIKNVVAAGTNNINPKAVEDAIKRGCRSFTLLFDADPTDQDPDKNHKHRSKAATTIIDTAEKLGMADVVRVYIADLPQPDNTKKVDPNDYIKQFGSKAVQQLIDQAQKSWRYELVNIVNKYVGQELTPKQLDSFYAAVLDISDKITDPIDREQYKNDVAGLLQLNNPDGTTTKIDPKAVEQKLAEHQARKQKETAQGEAAQLMEQASRLMRDGQITKALELQDKAAAMLAGLEAEQEFTKLTHRTTKAEIVAGLQQMPEAVATGLYLGEQRPEYEIILPAGALSILAAPTSHGKTTMLVALAVEAARNNPDKEYYLLSYEEAQEPIVLKALSCYAGIRLEISNRKTLQHYFTTGGWHPDFTPSEEKQQEYQRKEKEFFTMLEQGRLHLHYTNMVCETLCTNIRKLAAAGRLGGVFIDYVQYLELANSTRNYRRDEEISKICRMLKDAAVDTGTPIILAAQFNRQVTDPTKLALQNIGEGGDIERKAAYCLGFFNNDMPMLNTDKVNQSELQKITKGNVYDAEHPNKNKSVTAIVLKNRSGIGAKAGTTGLLSFDGNIGTVGNYTQQATLDNNTDIDY